MLVTHIPLAEENMWNVCPLNRVHYITVNKQINDKERIAAAMENPSLRELVEKCILEEDY